MSENWKTAYRRGGMLTRFNFRPCIPLSLLRNTARRDLIVTIFSKLCPDLLDSSCLTSNQTCYTYSWGRLHSAVPTLMALYKLICVKQYTVTNLSLLSDFCTPFCVKDSVIFILPAVQIPSARLILRSTQFNIKNKMIPLRLTTDGFSKSEIQSCDPLWPVSASKLFSSLWQHEQQKNSGPDWSDYILPKLYLKRFLEFTGKHAELKWLFEWFSRDFQSVPLGFLLWQKSE